MYRRIYPRDMAQNRGEFTKVYAFRAKEFAIRPSKTRRSLDVYTVKGDAYETDSRDRDDSEYSTLTLGYHHQAAVVYTVAQAIAGQLRCRGHRAGGAAGFLAQRGADRGGGKPGQLRCV